MGEKPLRPCIPTAPPGREAVTSYRLRVYTFTAGEQRHPKGGQEGLWAFGAAGTLLPKGSLRKRCFTCLWALSLMSTRQYSRFSFFTVSFDTLQLTDFPGLVLLLIILIICIECIQCCQ